MTTLVYISVKVNFLLSKNSFHYIFSQTLFSMIQCPSQHCSVLNYLSWRHHHKRGIPPSWRCIPPVISYYFISMYLLELYDSQTGDNPCYTNILVWSHSSGTYTHVVWGQWSVRITALLWNRRFMCVVCVLSVKCSWSTTRIFWSLNDIDKEAVMVKIWTRSVRYRTSIDDTKWRHIIRSNFEYAKVTL